MSSFTGGCLCGTIKYNSSADPIRMMNCHCKDCRKASGGPYLANVFIPEDSFSIEGQPKHYSHLSDGGNTMTKYFCGNCGSQVYGTNSGKPGTITIRGGTINETSVIKPSGNVYIDSKIPSTPLDNNLKIFPKMPK